MSDNILLKYSKDLNGDISLNNNSNSNRRSHCRIIINKTETCENININEDINKSNNNFILMNEFNSKVVKPLNRNNSKRLYFDDDSSDE